MPDEPRRLRVAADGIDVAAEGGVAQHEIGRARRPRRRSRPAPAGRADCPGRARRSSAEASRKWIGWPSEMVMARPRPITIMPSVMMKGGMPAERDAGAVDGAERDADREAGEDAPAAIGDAGVEQHRRDHRGDRDDRADREVDAGGQDDEGHADRDDAEQRDLARDVDQVEGVEEGAARSAPRRCT